MVVRRGLGVDKERKGHQIHGDRNTLGGEHTIKMSYHKAVRVKCIYCY